MNITVDSKAFKIFMKRFDKLEKDIKKIAEQSSYSKWITEEEAMQLTDLGKDALRKKRNDGVFSYSTATGRKIKYLRTDIENYLDNNSTIIK